MNNRIKMLTLFWAFAAAMMAQSVFNVRDYGAKD